MTRVLVLVAAVALALGASMLAAVPWQEDLQQRLDQGEGP